MPRSRRRVTFLLTDIEGSTRRWEADPERMRATLARHDDIVSSGVRARGGRVLTSRGEGDSFFAVFDDAVAAVMAAAEIQLRLAREPWPADLAVRVRMALNSGDAGRDVRGPEVNRCARLRAAAHGGQVLLTESTAELCTTLSPPLSLASLGLHFLKDVVEPVRVYTLRHPELAGDFPPIRSQDSAQRTLPIQTTAFVGRSRELEELRELLAEARLLTIVGMGGAGKTRLAVELAVRAAAQFPGGTWFTDLSGASDPAAVVRALATAMGVRERAGIDLLDLVAEAPAEPALLILDSCEHVVEACAHLAERLLGRSALVTVLCTSREPLHAVPEIAWRIPALSLPPAGRAADAAALEDFDAPRLFLARARMSRPAFAVGPSDVPLVLDICERLDGIPLAIELAAARLGQLSLRALTSDLLGRVARAGRRTLVARQRTLEATLDWSYRLLSEPERVLLRRLAVFAGGFSAAAAAEVAGGGPGDGPEELLAGLVDKSMVQLEEDRASAAERYRLLDVIRLFAERRLDESGEQDELRARHADHYLALAERAEHHLWGARQVEALDELDLEHDNLGAGFAFGRHQEPERGLRMCLALGRYWQLRGRLTEGRDWLDEVLATAAGPDPRRARALNTAAGLAWQLGDYAGAQERLEQSLSEWRELGDEAGIQSCLANLGVLAGSQGDFEAERRFYTESLELARRLGDRRAVGILLTNLGLAMVELGDPEAKPTLEEGLRVHRELGDEDNVVSTLVNLGIAAIREGKPAAARAGYLEALAIARRVGDVRNTAICLEGLAGAAALEGAAEVSLRLAGAAGALRSSIHAPPTPAAQARLEDWLAPARAALGRAGSAHWNAGRRMSLEEAVALVAAPAPASSL